MIEEKFAFSRLPTYLEWYQCYDDLSRKDWVDGAELRQNHHLWDERAKEKWRFFYRPFRPVVGRPQKKMIREREATVEACRGHIQESEVRIAEQRVRLQRVTRIFLVALGCLGLVFLYALAKDSVLFVLPLGGSLVALWKYHQERSTLLQLMAELEVLIAGYKNAIEINEREIGLLREEIRVLLAQVPETVSTQKIEEWLGEELSTIEFELLSEIQGTPVTKENVRGFLLQDFGDPRVFGLLIDSWGPLQPKWQEGPFGRESTGLGKASEALGPRATTWQIGGQARPLFRLLFLQYIFPLERNLNICSFFYDSVTRKQYGQRIETFQYNHVTNYSIRELDPTAGRDVDWGPGSMASAFENKSFKALTIAVSSGNHFRCVLVDDDLVNLLNTYLGQEEKFRALEASVLSDEELEKRFGKDQDAVRRWKEQELASVQAELRQAHQARQELHSNTARTSKTILSHVRTCVEHYVTHVQQPA